MIIEFEQLKKDAMKQKVLQRCREFEDYFEFCFIDDYEEKYDKSRVHSVQLGDVFVAILEEQDRYVLVSVQFFKERFSLTRVGMWINEMGIYFEDKICTEIDVPNANKIVDSLLFQGRPIIVHEKGHKMLSHKLNGCAEVSDLFESYDCIVNSANAKEVEVCVVKQKSIIDYDKL